MAQCIETNGKPMRIRALGPSQKPKNGQAGSPSVLIFLQQALFARKTTKTMMNKAVPTLAVLVALAMAIGSVGVADAHSTHYPHLKYLVGNASACQDVDQVPILSYHVHILFWQNNEKSTADALALRQVAMDHFNLTNAPLCTGLFDQGRLCAFEPDMVPAGPFVVAQWSFYFTTEQTGLIIPWFLQHHEPFTVLFHPNTGCEIEDHTTWAVWGGRPGEIDTSFLTHEEPGN
ncbi:hypothetical protein CAOG_03448 [Capsaspora owczarzaki ATCC 30864]|uniref:DOPA 4,5-dioxygenase n=1 Tax=Capsaspora owczarzaki (strain ATCC 30864) TaxID=595528 RepID=A0A0D2WPC8_CAPO3|nr:hypothetical protein CAOG_03448 [Capsaspora owczarzaki ATCC 30864]KJE92493.1 hypothetical protein CAOG_003448 [Capsaspora owczarzaki ATCC 30864]|eukprot:XP_004364287.2 hypothetical protein CAOG_03448 [Capsaspora owczarzaki ATCC 30864]